MSCGGDRRIVCAKRQAGCGARVQPPILPTRSFGRAQPFAHVQVRRGRSLRMTFRGQVQQHPLNRRKAAPRPELALGTLPRRWARRWGRGRRRCEERAKRPAGERAPVAQRRAGEVPARFIQRGARSAERLRMTSLEPGSSNQHPLIRTAARGGRTPLTSPGAGGGCARGSRRRRRRAPSARRPRPRASAPPASCGRSRRRTRGRDRR
jgi:hypothetical protein